MSPTPQVSRFSTRLTGSQPRRVNGWWFLRLGKGRTTWTVDGSALPLREGDIAWVRPGQLFGGFESTGASAVEVERIELPGPPGEPGCETSLLGSCLGLAPDEARSLASRLAAPEIAVFRPDEETGRLFSRLVRVPDPVTGFDRLSLRGGVLRILAEICRGLAGDTPGSSPGRSPTEAAVAGFLRELEQRCDDDWTLDSMAAGAGLKRSRFGTICRRLTGESPTTYLNRLRVRRGRRLLRETNRTVTEIAFDSGFSSSQYFAKIFKRFQGHEPTHYREIVSRGEGGGTLYLKGERGHNLALAESPVGTGDFLIEGEIGLERLGDTAASLEFGADRFGFDGREGRFFLEGETFGDARFFDRSSERIREGVPFPFRLERKRGWLTAEVGGARIFQIPDDPGRAVGKVGLRPLRNGIRVYRFEVGGEPAPLRERTA